MTPMAYSFDDAAVAHFDHAVAARGQSAIMRGHQQRQSLGCGDFQEQIEDGFRGLLVERSGGFIGEQNSWPVQQGAADGGALPLAAGEFLNAQIEPVEVVQLEDKTNFVSKKIERAIAFREWLAGNCNLAFVGCVESADQMQKGAFSAS